MFRIFSKIHKIRYTKIDDFDEFEKFVVKGQVLLGTFTAVILDVGKTACSQYMVITISHWPIEVRHSLLIISNVGVTHEVRGPRGLVSLHQVAR